MSLLHTVTRDTRFQGYLISQGTYVHPLLSTVHFDSEEHKTPEAFAPERFLNENGCFKKQNAFMLLSAGPFPAGLVYPGKLTRVSHPREELFCDCPSSQCRRGDSPAGSTGTRLIWKWVCLGEGLVRVELFLFFTTVLQRFPLSSPVDPQQLSLAPGVSNLGKVPQCYQLW
ncbi:unnamed protein product [Eretmochelys imbricata]